MLGRRGKHDEAEAIHRQTLAAKEKVLGDEHGSTMANAYCLVRLLGDQHRFEEATRLFEKACSEYNALGQNHLTSRACHRHSSNMLALEEDYI